MLRHGGEEQMKLHYGGKFQTKEDFKSQREHHEGAIAFREPHSIQSAREMLLILHRMPCTALLTNRKASSSGLLSGGISWLRRKQMGVLLEKKIRMNAMFSMTGDVI